MLSVIVPVRDWPNERIDASINNFIALGSKLLTEIIVVDFGSTKKVKLAKRKLLAPKVVRVEAKEWSLAEAINIGVISSSSSVIAKIDADTLISPDSKEELERAVVRVSSGELGLMVSQCRDFDSSVSLASAVEAARLSVNSPSKLRSKWGQGALTIFSKTAWEHIGGFESRFTGWGNEDNDFYDRIRFAGFRVDWTNQEHLKCYHVWHPPTYAKKGILANRQKNIKLAKDDKSILRPIRFPNSNAEKLVAPAAIQNLRPLVTLGVATTARPGRLKMIGEALESFRGQINNDVEIVVIDNGSPDLQFRALKKQLEAMKWPVAMRVERVEEASIPKARNVVTDLARGRYLCVVDDDDVALPNRLCDHLKVFEKNGTIHGSHGGWIDFDEESGVIERNQGKERSLATLLKGTGKVTCHPASFYRHDVVRAVRYDEAFLLGSDWDLALRMAMMGLQIVHTKSFVTLRRFHNSNVTLTGASDQVMRGLLARARQAVALGWKEMEGLQALAKANDAEVYCSNTASLESIVARLPRYVGRWQLFVPVTALAANIDPDDAEGGELSQVRAVAAPHHFVATDQTLLKKLYSCVSGSLCTRRSGSYQQIYYRSISIKGCGRALEMKKKLENLTAMPVELCSTLQADADRKRPCDWKSIKVDSGYRMLRSVAWSDCADALVARAKLSSDPILRDLTTLVSDYNESGECYFLMTPQVKGYLENRGLQIKLEKLTGYSFVQVSSGGVESDLLPGGRNH